LAFSYTSYPMGYLLRELSQYSNNAVRIATSKGATKTVKIVYFTPFLSKRGNSYYNKINT